MYNNDFIQMREFLTLTERCLYGADLIKENETVPDAPRAEDLLRDLLQDLKQLAFKLRAHAEDEHSDLSMGVETGMSRSADMIENLVMRHSASEKNGQAI